MRQNRQSFIGEPPWTSLYPSHMPPNGWQPPPEFTNCGHFSAIVPHRYGFAAGPTLEPWRCSMKTSKDFLGKVFRTAAIVALLVGASWATSSTQVIYSFAGDDDGEYTDSDLVLDGAGNIYGTTVLGGDFGTGSVFQLTPA